MPHRRQPTSEGSFNDFQAVNVSPLAPLPQCAVNSVDAVLTLDNVALVGTMAGATGAGTVAVITIPAGTMYFNPAGTFTDSSCTVPAFGPTGLTASIEVTEGATTLCTGTGTAKYGRAAEVGLVTASCGGYTLVFDGAQQPCFPGGPFPDPCALVPEWVGTWEQL